MHKIAVVEEAKKQLCRFCLLLTLEVELCMDYLAEELDRLVCSGVPHATLRWGRLVVSLQKHFLTCLVILDTGIYSLT